MINSLALLKIALCFDDSYLMGIDDCYLLKIALCLLLSPEDDLSHYVYYYLLKIASISMIVK